MIRSAAVVRLYACLPRADYDHQSCSTTRFRNAQADASTGVSHICNAWHVQFCVRPKGGQYSSRSTGGRAGQGAAKGAEVARAKVRDDGRQNSRHWRHKRARRNPSGYQRRQSLDQCAGFGESGRKRRPSGPGSQVCRRSSHRPTIRCHPPIPAGYRRDQQRPRLPVTPRKPPRQPPPMP